MNANSFFLSNAAGRQTVCFPLMSSHLFGFHQTSKCLSPQREQNEIRGCFIQTMDEKGTHTLSAGYVCVPTPPTETPSHTQDLLPDSCDQPCMVIVLPLIIKTHSHTLTSLSLSADSCDQICMMITLPAVSCMSTLRG